MPSPPFESTDVAQALDRLAKLEAGVILLTLGRGLLGGLFVFSGIRHFFIIPSLVAIITTRGVPAPRFTLVVGSLFQISAGILLMSGMYVAHAALGLVAFTLTASFMMLNYWNMQGPVREAAMFVWLSNLAIIGGLLIAASQEF